MTNQTHTPQLFIAGGGECGQMIRTINWGKTSLGAVEKWPQSLRTSVSICLNSNFPICIYWGKEHILLYNDAWAPIPGNKHPWAMGRTAREAWPEIWQDIGPLFEHTFQGLATGSKEALLFMHRHGYTEECYFDFTFTPIYGDDGQVGGVFNAVIEITYQVLAERRNMALHDLNKKISDSRSIEILCRDAVEVLGEAKKDLSFIMLYQVEEGVAQLMAADFDVPTHFHHCALDAQSLQQDGPTTYFARHLQHMVQEDAEYLRLTDLQNILPELPIGIWPEPTKEAMVLPLTDTSGKTQGFVVMGLSPRRALDEAYHLFFQNVATTLSLEINRVQVLVEERRRAEALAALDRAKTTFFSNISHEFRTPLTLMLGPLEQMLRQIDTFHPNNQNYLSTTHRNALRLLRLVNALLDFSRLEAGRMTAEYHPANLAILTADLASTFRSAIEEGGLRYHVDTHTMSQPAYVDAAMWEKIVLNLLSNAYKYTHQGQISLHLTEENGHAVLRVQDTGVGIPTAELPRMFDRFHRVQGVTGRSHEGTGIGLSLVRELVLLHGGDIAVESQEGQGSVFTVRIPLGYAHLPEDQVSEQPMDWALNAERVTLLTADIQDGPMYNGISTARIAPEGGLAGKTQQQVLVVDDNADMRAYIEQLLSPYFRVETAVNGLDALEKIRSKHPDLVLSDIMMPEMDGPEMLQILKSDPSTSMLPVILLSARAGEEARVEGLNAGADDYIVKPFSANELLARVQNQFKISQIKRREESRLHNVFAHAPVAACVFRGDKHIVELANTRMLELWGKTSEEVNGKPIFEGLSEASGQGFEVLLDGVYQTGETYSAYSVPIRLPRAGGIRLVYVDFTFEALYEADGSISGVMGVAVDVTEQVKALRTVEESAREKIAILNSLKANIAVLDAEGTITLVNDAWKEFARENGADSMKGSNVGDNYLEVLHNATGEDSLEAPVVYEGILAVMRGEESIYSMEYPCHSPTAQRWFLLQVSPLLEQGGGVVVSHMDITERRLAEEAQHEGESHLRQTQEELDLALTTGNIGVWHYDVQNDIVRWSKQQAAMFQQEPGTYQNGYQKWRACIHPDDRDWVEKTFQTALAKGSGLDYEFRSLMPDGSLRWIRAKAEIRSDAAGNPSYIVGVTLDTTEEKEAEKALRESEQRYRNLSDELELKVKERTYELGEINEAFEHAEAMSGIGNFKWNLDTGQVVWSKNMYAIYGISPETYQITLESIIDLMHPDDREWVQEVSRVVFETQIPTPIAHRILTPAGVEKHVFSSGAMVEDTSGQKIMVGTVQDVTSIKMQEKLLRDKNMELEKSNRSLEQFAHIASHDLQEPLRKIQTFANLLQRPNMRPEDFLKYTHKIEDSAARMSQLINSVLNYSRVSQSQSLFEPTDLNALIARIRIDFDLLIEEKGAVLESDDLPTVMGDSLQLTQLFSNLLSNALKFSTENPLIRIRAHAVSDQHFIEHPQLDPRRQYTHISFEDNGIGFSEEYSERIFAIFQRLHDKQTYAGTGIGLALCRKIVDNHGGEISAHGEEGKGARFDIFLPTSK